MKSISIIVAVSSNQVIGKNNKLAWNLPYDMKYFSNITRNHTVIMGRKNWESIPKKYRPLPNRTNIILTSKPNFKAEKCKVFDSLEKALEYSKLNKEKNPFIIGGGELYKYAIQKKIVDIIYLTRIHANIKGDTFFPELNLKEWNVVSEKFNKKDEKHKFDYTFLILEKIKIFS